MAKEEVQQAIAQLIEQYQGSRSTLSQLSEADVQAIYIEQLLLALGWDVYGRLGLDNSYHRQEYIRGAGYVDAGLKIAGEPVLFLEAKRFEALPRSSERLGDRTPEEKQAFRYARGMRLPYVILTNFERLHLFNADQERLILAFDEPEEYLSRLEELLFLSPERVKAGSLPWRERQIQMPDVDVSFLDHLRRWRLMLANAIYANNAQNPALKTDSTFHFDKLMEAVQRILDRLILIRYADDKEVLLQHDLLESVEADYRGRGPYAKPDYLTHQLIDLSHMMDKHHNTAIFAPGHICEQVFIPNETLASILRELNSISFRKFTSDILGNTYESYLSTKLAFRGSTIVSEEHREIRKGKGIYYTPRYIVKYIVDNTLGRLLQELEDAEGVRAIDKAKKIKVLDPACGSGSFLIYAYQVLAVFYKRINKRIQEEQAKLLAPAAPDMFQRLELLRSLPEPLFDYQRHVLEEQLYGVDLDPEAAEIAAVNLTMQAFADARREKLPLILNKNVKVGNSLISGSPEELKRYFGDSWEDKHPFIWEEEFPDIMKAGRFDVVIGNPPYVSFGLRGSERAEEHLGQYLRDKFPNSAEYKLSTYSLFIDRGLQLLKEGGCLGYILPDSFLLGRFFSKLRKRILDSCAIKEVVLFAEDFWSGGTIGFPVIPTFQRVDDSQSRKNNQVGVRLCAELNELQLGTFSKSFSYEQSYFEGVLHYRFRLFFDEISKSIVDKLEYPPLPLRNVADIYSGCIGRFGQDSIKSKTKLKKLEIRDKQGNLVYSDDNAERHWQPLLESGSEIGRYFTDYAGHFVYYHPSEASKRIYAKSGFEEEKYIGEKLFLRQTGDSLVGTYDSENYFCLNNMHVIHLLPDAIPLSLKYIVAILNSKLMNHYYHLISLELGRAMAQTDIETIEQLPIRRIDFDNPMEKKMHDDLVALVERMLDLKKRLARLDQFAEEERRELEREIERTDKAIDNLAYDLYGLTEEERQMVEAGVKR